MTGSLDEWIESGKLDIALLYNHKAYENVAWTEMMVEVVNNGSGKGAQIQGVQVAGKTGTAEDNPRSPTLWFTSFAPADDPQVAVAVVLENQGQSTNETTGGALASPIARQIMQAAISR